MVGSFVRAPRHRNSCSEECLGNSTWIPHGSGLVLDLGTSLCGFTSFLHGQWVTLTPHPDPQSPAVPALSSGPGIDIPGPEEKENALSEAGGGKASSSLQPPGQLSSGLPWISFSRGIQSHRWMADFPGCSRHLRLQAGSLQGTRLRPQINT